MKNYELHFPRWILIIVELETNNSMTSISRKLDTTYSFLSDIIILFEKHGYITRIKKGRECDIILTEKGKEISKICKKLFESMGVEKC
jgi:predicted transcriptional regulator